jgi:gamma-glutamylaminecyclotransferase
MKVFVYGTLRQGEGNHRLLARARCVGQARTRPEFSFHSLGGFTGMIAGGQQEVLGEVYEVDQYTLDRLDRLEGHPRFYRRTAITLADGTQVDTYLLPRAHYGGHPVIASGDWRTYRRN